MKKLIPLFILLSFIFQACNNPVQPLLPISDNEPPMIEVTSHSAGDFVSSTINLSGTVEDDVKMDRVDIAVITYKGTRATENSIGSVTIPEGELTWSIAIDTTAYNDGEKLFKIYAYDETEKVTSLTLNLVIDNEGPQVSIIEPQPLSGDNFISPFQVKVVIADDADVAILNWKLVSEDDENLFISGIESTALSGVFKFIISPSDFIVQNTGFTKGWCQLNIGCSNSRDVYTKDEASVRLYVDFSQDTPIVTVNEPAALHETDCEILKDNVPISGYVIDDDGVKRIDIRYNSTVLPEPVIISTNYTDIASSVNFENRLTGLSDGVYDVDVMAYDMYGTTSDWSVKHYFRIANNIPDIIFTAPVENSKNSSDVNITADISSPVAANITEVSVKINDGSWETISTDSGSSYSLDQTFDSTTVTETNTIKYYVRATDENGGVSTSYLKFYIDNVDPLVSILQPSAINTGLNKTFAITGTASDMSSISDSGTISLIEITIDDGVVAPYTESATGTDQWSYEYDSSNIVDTGVVNIDVIATDSLNNTGTASMILNIDQSADIPLITVTYPVPDQWLYGNVIVFGEAVDDDGIASIRVSVDDETTVNADYSNGSWSYELFTEEFVDGGYWHYLHCQAVDIYGATSDEVDVRFARDNMVPNVWINPGENQAINTSTLLTGGVYQGNGEDVITSVQISLTGKRSNGTDYTVDWTTSGLTITGLNTEDVDFEYVLDTTVWSDGLFTVFVKVKDSKNREQIITRRLYLDTVSPTGSFISPAEGEALTGDSTTISGSSFDAAPSSGIQSSYVRVDCEHEYSGTFANIITGVAPDIISGSISAWTYNWDISAFNDGIYHLYLNSFDRAANTVKNVERDIRIMRYPPSISNLMFDGRAAVDYIYINDQIVITGDITDNDIDDLYGGISSVEVYLSDNSIVDTSDILIESEVFPGNPDTTSFNITHDFSQKKNYLIVRATDKVGGYSDQAVRVQLDFEAPEESFKYSSAGYYPLFRTNSETFSDTLWIILDAADDSDITGGLIDIKIGSTPGASDIISESTFVTGEVLKLDLKQVQFSTIYISYNITDIVGNTSHGIIPVFEDSDMPLLYCNELDAGFIDSSNMILTGYATGGDKSISSVMISKIDGSLDDLSDVSGYSDWSYELSSIPGDTNLHYIYILVTASDGSNFYKKYEFYSDDSDPVLTQFDLSDSETSGTIAGSDLSGIIRVYGTLTDNYGDLLTRYDISIVVELDGVEFSVSQLDINKNGDSEFEWFFDWDTSSSAGQSNVQIEVKAYDGSGREVSDSITGYDVIE